MKHLENKGWMTETTTTGFTLVEMVAVMAILGIVGLASTHVTVEAMRIYARTAPALNASYQAFLSVQRMRHDIRDMKDTASITTFTATALTFDDSSDNTIAYSLASGDLLRNGDLLARNVTSLSLDYWKSDGTAASAASDLHLVEIDLTVQSGAEPYRLQAAVFPRALSP